MLYYHLVFQSTQLFDNKADIITVSWTQGNSSVCAVQGSSCEFRFTVLEPDFGPRSCGCRWDQSFKDSNLWVKIKGIPRWTTCLSFLYASTSPGKVHHFPGEAGILSELQGHLYQGPRGLSVNLQSPENTQCYPHCLHISVAFPDNIWIRKLLSNNSDTGQLTVFPINLIKFM